MMRDRRGLFPDVIIMSAWRILLALSTMTLAPLITLADPTGIKYFIATLGGQNCDSVCTSFGLQCAGTGQSFPKTSALSIFQSLGITCETRNDTDSYLYLDQPNYISALPPTKTPHWVGRCTGFKAIPSTIDCHTAENLNVRRLCPCFDISSATLLPTRSTPALTTHEITTTISEKIVTSTQTKVSEEHSTGNNAPQRQTEETAKETKEETNGRERTALIVVSAMFAVVLLMCLFVLLFLFVRRRKHISRGKRDKGRDCKKCPVKYHKNNCGVNVVDMTDGSTVFRDEDNSYCELINTCQSTRHPNEMEVKKYANEPSNDEDKTEKTTDNVLYVSGEAYCALSQEKTPSTYERLVNNCATLQS